MVVIDTETVQALNRKSVHSICEGGSRQLHVQGLVAEILHVAFRVSSIWPPEFGSRMRVQSIAHCEISVDHNSVERWRGTPIPKNGVKMQGESSLWRSEQIESNLKEFWERIGVHLGPVMLHGAAANHGIERSRLVGGPVLFCRTLADVVENRMSCFAVLSKF